MRILTQLISIKKKSSGRKHSESVKEALPTPWIHKCIEILTKNNFEWPKSLSSEYFNWLNPETASVNKVWSPVSTYLYLMMLEIPLRKIQVQQLDSGEGDSLRYNLESHKWEKNNGKHANHWLKLKTKRNERGAISKITTKDNEMAGLYINTNKTQDINCGYDETSGYIIHWQHEKALQIIDELRSWQEKFNPVTEPLEFKDVPTASWGDEPTKMALECTPSRFYLFRNPTNHPESAPASNSKLTLFWHRLMEKLQSVLRAEGQEVTIVINYGKNGQPCRSLFTPHGLRVAGLTALYEQGVPIEILSKVVAGHASILMTIYYIKLTPFKISATLNEARRNADLKAQNSFLNELSSLSSYEQAKKKLVSNSEEAIRIHESRLNLGAKTNYTGSPIGLCPHNGTACETGGPVIRSGGKNKENAYGPVEGGPSNCARCRYLITGSPWLVNLWLEGCKKLAQAQSISKHVDQLRVELIELESQLHSEFMREGNATSNLTKKLNHEINSLQSIIMQKSKLLDEELLTAHAIHNLINQIKLLPEDKDSYALIVHSDAESPIEYDETSRFEALNLLVQAGSIWKHVENADFVRERNEFIDQIIFSAGAHPLSFTPLSTKEKQIATNAVADFLLAKLSRHELIQLENGEQSLENLGISPSLKSSLQKIERSTLQSNLVTKTGHSQ